MIFNIIMMILLIVGMGFGIALWVLGVQALTKCQNNESMACPSYSCPVNDPDANSDTNCGIKPWRIDENGKKVCMTYLAESVIPKGSSALN